MRFEGKLGRLIGRGFHSFVCFLRRQIVIRGGASGFSIESHRTDFAQRPIDERIAMIDQARHNLVLAVSAIDELKHAAENNKQEIAEALRALSSLAQNKSSLENEVEAIKEIAEADAATFRMLARIPSDADIRRERLLGFIIGVVASIVAALIVWIVSLVVRFFLR